MQKQKLTQKFSPRTASILAPVYLVATCLGSYAEVPKTAFIRELAPFKNGMTVHSGNTKPKKAKLNFPMKWNDSLWVPNDGSHATLRFYNSANRDMGTRIDAIPRSGLTKYSMPCKAVITGGADFIVTWENGSRRSCEKGLKVTSKDFANITHRSFPQNMSLAQKDKSLLGSPTNIKASKAKVLLQAQAGDASIRYYCSALPSSDGGSAGMVAGFSSMEEACNNATQKCLKNNNNGDCLIASTGDWNVNDPELTTSVICKNRKSSHKKVRGADISNPGSGLNEVLDDLLKQALGDLGGVLGKIFKLKPGTCVLEVYSPGEVIISPTTSQQTVVNAIDVGNGGVQVDVKEGQVLLRSTESSEGIKADKGASYRFNGEGLIILNNNQTSPNDNPPSPTGPIIK
jgi:hypothetical protein